ncbi:hypothetical protein [Klebsiella oxytoca]|uniref:hypothetical protein n=1 Tax=Klebsiella oxytoca TaxID=571 RepID=UPI00292D9E0C|nr:hypothetical protein [Klebsiella oxytoca]
MNILLISNDVFFTYGMQELLQREGFTFNNIHLDDLSENIIGDIAGDYDLVMFDSVQINNVHKLLPMQYELSKLIVVVDIPSVFIAGNHHIISKRSTMSEIIKKFGSLVNYSPPQISLNELHVIQLSIKGEDISNIASKLNIADKSTYRLRYNLVYKLGFLRYHPVTVFYCGWLCFFMTKGNFNGRALYSKSDSNLC